MSYLDYVTHALLISDEDDDNDVVNIYRYYCYTMTCADDDDDTRVRGSTNACFRCLRASLLQGIGTRAGKEEAICHQSNVIVMMALVLHSSRTREIQ